MVIGIDNGNANTKTSHFIFNSGLRESAVSIPMAEDCIYYNGIYYYLASRRGFYQKDKTQDSQCFILTLFGICKELELANINASKDYVDIELAVGLPPLHYSSLRDKFSKYFVSFGKKLDFKYNDKDIKLVIKDVKVYPQAYSAITDNTDLKQTYARLYVIDNQEAFSKNYRYTTDVVGFRNNKLDAEYCFSLENGIITMCNEIKLKASSLYDFELEEDDIINAICDNNVFLSNDIINLIKNEAAKYTARIINQLREYGINAKSTKAVFVGGGSILLKEYISDNSLISNPIFIEDSKCNAIGYTKLSTIAYREQEKRKKNTNK